MCYGECSAKEKNRLGDLLVEKGVICKPQLVQALSDQKKTGQKLGRQPISSGLVNEQQLMGFLSAQLQIPFIDLKQFKYDPQTVKLIPYTSVGSTLGNYTQNLNAGETTLSGAGTALSGLYNPANPLELSAPGTNNYGNVNVLLNVDSWLEYNWARDCDGDSINDNGSCSTAFFGLYRGDDRIIFQREVLP